MIYFRGLDVNRENRENNMSAKITCFTVFELDLERSGVKIAVEEVPGTSLKRNLQRSDPFREKK